MNGVKIIKLFDMETLEFSGTIIAENGRWQYKDVTNPQLLQLTHGMPLKALLGCLAALGLVYDIEE